MRQSKDQSRDQAVVVIGGGFCGLAAAFYLARAGVAVVRARG